MQLQKKSNAAEPLLDLDTNLYYAMADHYKKVLQCE